MFIVIEGGDASGKSTIINKMEDLLKNKKLNGMDTNNTKILKSPTQPFDKIWKEIDKNKNIDTLTRYYFFRAAIQNDSNTVKNLIDSGYNVIIERYMYSVEAFNKTYDEYKKTSNTHLSCKEHINYSGLLTPDLVFCLDLSDKEREKRILSRKEQGNELSWWENNSFQKSLNSKLREIGKSKNFKFINTEALSVNEAIKTIEIIINKKQLFQKYINNLLAQSLIKVRET